MGILTEADRQMLPMCTRAGKGFHLGCQWYFNWEPLWYQYAFHQLETPNVTFIAGIAAGKTTSVAASYMMDCITTPYFRALNTSVTAKQSELPFEMVQPWIENGTKVSHFVEDIILRPYPTIKFYNGSEWIFRTAGKDARFIRGMEFDRINYDEAGLDYAGETLKVLRGRLRGTRPDGTLRMCRFDVTTSPTDAPWLVERFERGWKDNPNSDLANYYSFRIATYDNTRLTRQMISLMEKEYSDDMIDVELRGMFPEYGLSMFPKSHIIACANQSLNDALEAALRPEDGGRPKPGYALEEHPRYGITKFELPADPKSIYVLGGDPGQDSPPHRNAPVVMVMDITKKPHQVVYFHWIEGKGSYMPFLNSFKYALEKYAPVLRGIDTTGTQKAIDELAFENMGISVDGISFNRDKEAMLNSLSLAITEHNLEFPLIKGLMRQLSSYARDVDNKIPQDIVMTMAELAFLARYVPEETPNEGRIMGAKNNFINRRRNAIPRDLRYRR